jgi:GT2 family glycosyltransferase/glycosyltransferase involved in cell wall biosynthesis
VIPTYGEHPVTRQCLASLSASGLDLLFEVIVVDDAYSEPLDVSSIRVQGARVIRNEQNLGFLRSCNKAMASARGHYLLLLNNDTVVHPGAVEALLSAFEDHKSVGAVCAQLRFEDGSLQEAGGIVWRDGSAWNWGRGEDPHDPRFSYPREVDYGSAAALMVERRLWERIGGFDESFAPAYYEDTDFCFAVRAAGYRVIYQPQAVITHLEGISHGTDTGAGMKSHQVTNQGRFTEKWRGVLHSHRANGVDPMLERDRGARARILWVEACMLTPDQDSGSQRTIRLLRILVQMGCKVTFIADNLDGAEPYRTQLASEGIEVIHAPYCQSVEDYLKKHGDQYDVITLCRHYIAIQHTATVRAVNPGAQIWFDTIDLHYLRSRRQFALDNKKSTQDRAELAYREEMSVIADSDVILVVSDIEAEELAKEAPSARVAVVSNIHEISEVKAERQGREGVVFVGGFQHPPNIDAVEFYAKEIWPLFREQCPGVPTYIIGSRMPDGLRKLGESHGLNMLGFVEDLMPYYTGSVLSIAPLRYGAGVKGKVNEALSFGLPVVGTSAALEGMGLEHGRQAMLADSAKAFAAAMAEAYSNQALWNALSENGQHSLQDRFTPQVAKDALDEALRVSVSGWAGR